MSHIININPLVAQYDDVLSALIKLYAAIRETMVHYEDWSARPEDDEAAQAVCKDAFQCVNESILKWCANLAIDDAPDCRQLVVAIAEYVELVKKITEQNEHGPAEVIDRAVNRSINAQ
jgi:hypothetical protein